MTVVAWIAGSMLAASALLAIVRLVRGPSALDRAAALEVVLSSCLGGIAVLVATTGVSSLLIVLVVLSLLAFVGGVSIARFANARGGRVSAVLDVAGGVFLVLGALLTLLASIGLLRLPDVLSRMHAVTKVQGLGLLLVLLGAALQLRNGFDITTLVLVAVFQLITTPVAANLVGGAAYRTGRHCRSAVVHDELADD